MAVILHIFTGSTEKLKQILSSELNENNDYVWPISNDIILNVRYYNMYWVGAILFCQILMLVITLTNYERNLQEVRL